MSSPIDRREIEAWYRGLQDRLCLALEEIADGARFASDTWERPGGGGGTTRVLSSDGPIEKAAVNVSAVWGPAPKQLSDGIAAGAKEFFASGLSTIVHPSNPHAPTFHANIRYLETDDAAWFGGGADLTPFYLYEADAHHFHDVLKDVCGRHAVADYPAWKVACDAYFRLLHRGEARGVGGIFFDHLTDDLDDVWAFQQDLGEQLAPSYLPILHSRIDIPYGADQVAWHEIRRGRYVEFNLVWDRGTRFGIETDGRTESILASLPPRARWVYDHRPEPDSPEATLLELVRGKPRDW